MSIERDSLTTISFFCPTIITILMSIKIVDWIWIYKTERISLSERQHNINENIC